MKTTNLLVFLLLIGVAAVSCIKIQSLPDKPRIEFTSFSIFDTTDILGNEAKGGRLKFHFEDGDGDLGLPVPSGIGDTDSINLFFKLFRMHNGVIAPAPDNDPLTPSGYRIPFMANAGENKVMTGTISVTFFYLFYSENDSVSYNFFVKDRANHISNIDSTGVIPVFYNGVYER